MRLRFRALWSVSGRYLTSHTANLIDDWFLFVTQSTPVSMTSAASTNQALTRLQQQVRALQAENVTLRRAKFGASGAMSQSFTDLAATSFSDLVSAPRHDVNHCQMCHFVMSLYCQGAR